MAEIRVSVTADDIARGKRDDCNRCPVALAVMRATGSDDVWAGVALIVGDRRYETSGGVWQFMEDFDKGRGVHPFEFTLSEAAP